MFKLTLPKSRKEWAKTIVVFVLLFAIVTIFVGAPYAGWWPAYGRSAWPTMKWWTFPPYHSGYYHVDRSDKNPEPGDIVWFWVPGHWPQTEVKRVDKVEMKEGPDGLEQQMWLTADNSGVTGEGSDFSDRYDWVPTRLVIGTVDDIWTPTRWARSKTSGGSLKNWIELWYRPGRFVPLGNAYLVSNGQCIAFCTAPNVLAPVNLWDSAPELIKRGGYKVFELVEEVCQGQSVVSPLNYGPFDRDYSVVETEIQTKGMRRILVIARGDHYAVITVRSGTKLERRGVHGESVMVFAVDSAVDSSHVTMEIYGNIYFSGVLSITGVLGERDER